MKIKSLPKHIKFYQRWLPLLTGLITLSYLGQVISGVTESMPIFTTLYNNISSFFGENGYVFWSCVSVTIAVVILLESSLRLTLKQSFKFLWEKVNPKGVSHELREEIKNQDLGKLDNFLKVMTVFFALTMLVLLQLISWNGSHDTTDFLKEEVIEVDSIAIMDSVIYDHQLKYSELWTKDSLMICSQFDSQIDALKSSFESEEEAHRITANKYMAIDPVKYATRISNENRKAAQVRANGNRQLLSIRSEKSDSISIAYNRFKKGLDESKEKGKQIAEVEVSNYISKKKERDEDVESSGLKLAWGTVLGSIILFITLFFQTAVHHGSEKREAIKESPLEYYPSYFKSLIRSRKERLLYKRYGKIFSYKKHSPPPPLPKEEDTLVDFHETIGTDAIKIAASKEDEAKTFVLPQKTALVAVYGKRNEIGFGDKEANNETSYKVVNRTVLPDKSTDNTDSRTEGLVTVATSAKSCPKKVVCACGCGRSLRGKRKDAIYFDNTCRARAGKRRGK